jgi:hypothetical protein
VWDAPNGTATFSIVKQDVLQLTRKILADEANGVTEEQPSEEAEAALEAQL